MINYLENEWFQNGVMDQNRLEKHKKCTKSDVRPNNQYYSCLVKSEEKD